MAHMAHALLATLLLVSSAAHTLALRPLRGASGSSTRSMLQQPFGATLRWSEEFNSLDTASWNLVQGDGTGTPAGAGWGNGEAECYTSSSDNARVVPSTDPNDAGNSWLSITALKQGTSCNNGPNQPTTWQPWSSAKLTTQSKHAFMWTSSSNLRVEARIKIPTGPGSWPAFWMLPEPNAYGGWCNSGEIDIMEHINDASTPVHGTLHYGGPWPTCVQSGGSTPVPTLDTGSPADWHVYSVDWAPTYVAFSLDGAEYYRVQRGTWWSGSAPGANSAPFDQPFYIILNLAVGGAWPCPDGNCAGTPQAAVAGPYTMLVDYVRVWDVPTSNPAAPSFDTLPTPLPSPAKAVTSVPSPVPTPTPAPQPTPIPTSGPQPSPAPAPALAAYPPCPFSTPCPTGTYYYCQSGISLLGQKFTGCSVTPFSSNFGLGQCSQQCLSIKPLAAATSTRSPSPAPTPRPTPAVTVPTPQPTPAPAVTAPNPADNPYPTCAFTTPCPSGAYFYCQAGGNYNGCAPSPFPGGSGVTQCSQQCLSVK